MDERDVRVRAKHYEEPSEGMPVAGILCALTALVLVLLMIHALA